MMRRTRLLPALAAVAFLAGCQYNGGADTSTASTSTPTSPTTPTAPTTPTTPTDPGTTTPAPAPAGLTYTKDVAPILNVDCARCHGPSRRDAGYDMSSYAGVMRAVTAGSASSLLIRVTQSNGIMYGELSGNRAQKAQTIHDWIVTYKAQQ